MANSSHIPSKSVLYIESSDLIMKWVGPLIARLGYHLVHTPDREAAEATVNQNQRFDLILLGDVSRPTGDSTALIELNLLKHIRANKTYARVPVVVFTGLNWISEAREAGAADILIKPDGAEDLEPIILYHLTQTP